MVRALALVVLGTFASTAQAETLVGRVVDSGTGQPLSNFQIRLQSPAHAAISDTSGWFTFLNLDPGLYWAEVSGSYHESRFVRLAAGDTSVIALKRTGYPRFTVVHPVIDPTVPPKVIGSLRVRAIDDQARPIAGISVHVDPSGFALTDSTGWCVFPSVSGGMHQIRIGSLKHENQQDSVLVRHHRLETIGFVMRVREPYRGRREVTLNANGDLRIDDGSSATVHGRDGSTWIEDRFPFTGFGTDGSGKR